MTFLVMACLLASLGLGCGGGGNGTSTGPADGTGFDNAIRVGSVGEERDIMNRSDCGSGGYFRVAALHIEERDGRYFDVVDAECTQGSGKRQFYFDVTSCFPCKN